ncbi:unnamed protein product, partial [Prorocentrum cordatum]
DEVGGSDDDEGSGGSSSDGEEAQHDNVSLHASTVRLRGVAAKVARSTKARSSVVSHLGRSRSVPGGGRAGSASPSCSEKARLDELIGETPVSTMLDGGKVGDRTYALRRFRPQMRGIEINRTKHLAKVDAAVSLHANLNTMGVKERNDMLDLFGADDVIDATSFQRRLIGKLVSVKRPRVFQLRLSHKEKCDVCLDMFLTSFVAEVVAAGSASVELVRDAAKHLKIESGAITSGECAIQEFIDLARTLQCAADALLVISDPSPNATDNIADRATSRALLNGTRSKEWELFADSLHSNPKWAAMTKEYLEYALSNLQIGPEIAAAVGVVKSRNIPDIVKVSRRMRGWVDGSRTGGASSLEEAFAEWVDAVASYDYDSDAALTQESARQVCEAISNVAAAAKSTKASGVLVVSKLAAAAEGMEAVAASITSKKKREKDDDGLTLEGMSELKAAVLDLNGEVFAGAGVATDFEVAAIHLCKLVFCSPDATFDPSDASTMKDQADAVMSCILLVHEDSRADALNGLNVRLGHIMTICAAIQMKKGLVALGDVDAQVMSGDEGVASWGALKAALGQVDTSPPNGPGGVTIDGVLTIDGINEKWGASVAERRGLAMKYAEAVTDGTMRAIKRIQERIAAVAGGMPDGSSWKEGLNEDHSYDDVVAHAKQTLFKNKLGKTINVAL